MLHKMASSDVGIWENPSVLLWSLWSVVFFKRLFAGFVVNPIMPVRALQAYRVGSCSIFLFPAPPKSILHLSALFTLGVCGFFIEQAGSPPLSNIEECKCVMRVRVVFVAKREQMLSEMLWWFPPQIRLPILPAPPAVKHSPLIPVQPGTDRPAAAASVSWAIITTALWCSKQKSEGFLFHITKSHTVQRERQLFLKV